MQPAVMSPPRAGSMYAHKGSNYVTVLFPCLRPLLLSAIAAAYNPPEMPIVPTHPGA
jgi:hypothetical protein